MKKIIFAIAFVLSACDDMTEEQKAIYENQAEFMHCLEELDGDSKAREKCIDFILHG